jgi:acyl carrier protein phosphodiesterase
MNYLAHIALSGEQFDAQLGGLLGDFLKGRLQPEWLALGANDLLLGAHAQGHSSLLVDATDQLWSREVLAGVYLHRSIDAYVDQLPEFKACVERLGVGHRRIAGIALDVFFDHLLASYWAEHDPRSLPDFCGEFYQCCEDQQQRLPENARVLIGRAKSNNLFERYADLDLLEQVLERIAQRLSRRTTLFEVMPVLRRERSFLAEHFHLIMPQLQQFSAQQRQQLSI